METLNSLNHNYKRIQEFQAIYCEQLNEYIEKALEYFNGQIALNVIYKSYEEAEEAGEDFDEQFPICLEIQDRHSWVHPILVAKVYKQNNLYQVDGYDKSSGEWVQGWYAYDCVDTYDELAYFINEVIGWIKEGAKCKWNDPAINDYPEEERVLARNRVFTIRSMNNGIINIVGESTEAEVPYYELIPCCEKIE